MSGQDAEQDYTAADEDAAVAALDQFSGDGEDVGTTEQQPTPKQAQEQELAEGFAEVLKERPRDERGKFVAKQEKAVDERPQPAGVDESQQAADAQQAEPVADPFAGWQRFPFAVDKTEVALDGVLANDTHIVIPRTVWDAEFRPKYLANRESWQGERAQYRQAVDQARYEAKQATEQRTQREVQAQAIQEEFDALIRSGPEAIQQFLADYERNAPILRAQIEAREARSRVEAYERQEQERRQRDDESRQAAELDRMFAEGERVFTSALDELLKESKYAVLAGDRGEILERLTKSAERNSPAWRMVGEDGRGGLTVDRETLAQHLDKEVARIARLQSQWQKTVGAERRNLAAVASPVTTPQKNGAKPKAPPVAAPKRNEAPATVSSRRITDDEREALASDYASILR